MISAEGILVSKTHTGDKIPKSEILDVEGYKHLEVSKSLWVIGDREFCHGLVGNVIWLGLWEERQSTSRRGRSLINHRKLVRCASSLCQSWRFVKGIKGGCANFSGKCVLIIQGIHRAKLIEGLTAGRDSPGHMSGAAWFVLSPSKEKRRGHARHVGHFMRNQAIPNDEH